MSDSLTYLDWLKRLPGKDADYAGCICPVCKMVGLRYQYFGFADSEFGWKLVWCSSCSTGIRISRTKIPASAQVLIGESAQQQFLDDHSGINLIA